LIDLVRQRLLPLAQARLLSPQALPVVLRRLKDKSPDLVQPFASGDELALDLIRLATQRILDLT